MTKAPDMQNVCLTIMNLRRRYKRDNRQRSAQAPLDARRRTGKINSRGQRSLACSTALPRGSSMTRAPKRPRISTPHLRRLVSTRPSE